MKDKNALIGMAMAMNLSVEKQNMIQIYITKSLKVLLQTFPMFGTHTCCNKKLRSIVIAHDEYLCKLKF